MADTRQTSVAADVSLIAVFAALTAAFSLTPAIPVAAGVLYPFLLGPSIAALAMSGSSALVAINALMLKRTKLTGIGRQRAPASAPALTPGLANTEMVGTVPSGA